MKNMTNDIISGIYRITNSTNNKVYIGQSKNIFHRWLCHRNLKIKKRKTYLQNAILKYGFSNFKFEIIKETHDLDKWEKFFIFWHQSNDPAFGYNMTTGGEGLTNPSFEIRERIRQKTTGVKQSKETIEKRRKKLIGHEGPTFNDFQKATISKSLKSYYEKHPSHKREMQKNRNTCKIRNTKTNEIYYSLADAAKKLHTTRHRDIINLNGKPTLETKTLNLPIVLLSGSLPIHRQPISRYVSKTMKKVKDLKTNMVFESQSQAAHFFNTSVPTIRAICAKSIGKKSRFMHLALQFVE
jgi:group I intron endonuclease